MNPQDMIELSRQALQTVLVLSLPVLGIALIVGLLVSTLQAMTHIHDQTIGTVIKLIAVFVVLLVAMPWLVDMMVDYSEMMIRNAPQTIQSSM